MNKRHYEHTLPNIRGSLSNTYLLLVHVAKLSHIIKEVMDGCTQKIEYYIIRTINLKGCTIVYSLCTFLHFIHSKKE